MRSQTISKLAAAFRKLPGVGPKTAMRYAYAVIEMDKEQSDNFVDAIIQAKAKIKMCSICGDYTENEICELCGARDKSVVCVVSRPKDVIAFEKMGDYNGVYHVLHGELDFQKGVGVDNIRIKELLDRINSGGIKEIIIATNPDVTGELTASYLAGIIKPLGVKVTRLAYGISIGSEIEYADELTLQRALQDRKEL
ncbi:MAG: recombination mediator RecR [Christensenellales bacterium]|jgi:recombination protein RecR|nr:recombination protein RecR [Clostridiales bacterium]